MKDLPPAGRVPLLVLGMVSLVAGTLAGLARLGWDVPGLAAARAGSHGALMVCAFFGTVISLERAVALGRGWAYLAPAAAGLGGLALLAGAPPPAAPLAASLAAAVLVAASLRIMARLVAPFTIVLALAAGCWLAGNLAWLAGADAAAAAPCWFAFLVLTIAGERLELTRFLPTPPAARSVFLAIVGVVLGGAGLSLGRAGAGYPVFAGGLLALALWLSIYDIARHNAGQTGLTRFIAVCLLGAYGWLAAAGALGLAGAFAPGHPWRDAALHSLGLGFVFSMVFGHAPIIFPAITRVRIPYRPAFYLPLALLHATLALRVGAGLGDTFARRQDGGLGNALALLAFIVTLATAVILGRRPGRPGP